MVNQNHKTCFIIMPITTPQNVVDLYRDGSEHFKHVLDCLFIPAINKAGYFPKPPFAKGSDLIHAEIISNLESADIVLCDMSSLNANVFFEFGIRTSLNKPVCVVKDDLTKHVPFDTGILNHQVYKSSLEPWELDAEIHKLSEHLTASLDRSKGANTLWKYFGLKSEAVPYKGEAGDEGKLDYLTLQLDSLREKVDEMTNQNPISRPDLQGTERFNEVWNSIKDRVPRSVIVHGVDFHHSGNEMIIQHSGSWNHEERSQLYEYIWLKYRIKVKFITINLKDVNE